MDLKRLAYFVRIAELGSLSAAADALHVSQPALSRQLRLLEDELGARLFARHRRGMHLTREGRDLHDGIARPLERIERALRDFRGPKGRRQASLVLGLPPSVGNVLAGSLARRMAADAPDIALRLVEGFAGHLAAAIAAREVDAALLYGPASAWPTMKWGHCLEGLLVEELLDEELVLVGAASSALDPGRPVAAESLTALPLVMPGRDNYPPFLRALAAEIAERFGKPLNHQVDADSFQLTRQFVESGLGFALLPYSAIARDVEAGHLRHAPIRDLAIRRQLVLAVRPDSSAGPAIAVLADAIRKEMGALMAAGAWPGRLLFQP